MCANSGQLLPNRLLALATILQSSSRGVVSDLASENEIGAKLARRHHRYDIREDGASTIHLEADFEFTQAKTCLPG